MTTPIALHPTPERRTAATDASPRLHWADLVRAASLLVVVLGHYLMALVVLTSPEDAAPAVQVTALLDVAEWSHPLTWLLQVMPCFFAVGAVVAAPRFAAQAPGWREWRDYMAPRVRSLLLPALPLLALWWMAGPLLVGTFGIDLATAASQAAVVPLWFLAVYLLVQALLPLAVPVIARFGVWKPLAALLLTAAVVDTLHLAGVPMIGWLNFPAVWMIPTVLGSAVGLGRVVPRDLLRGGLVALATGVLLVVVAGYPVPLVGVTDAARSNNSPPSLLLGIHALAYAGLVLWGAPRCEAWLGRTDARRRALSLAGTWSMGVYVWHMTGLVLLVATAVLLPVPVVDPLLGLEPLSAAWWLARPAFMAAGLAVTGLVIAAVTPATRGLLSWSGRRDLPSPGLTVLVTLCASVGIATTVLNGTATLSALAIGLLGIAVAGVHGRPRDGG